MDFDGQERIDSVNRYIRGNKPANICRDAGRLKTWLFTGVSRPQKIQSRMDKLDFSKDDTFCINDKADCEEARSESE